MDRHQGMSDVASFGSHCNTPQSSEHLTRCWHVHWTSASDTRERWDGFSGKKPEVARSSVSMYTSGTFPIFLDSNQGIKMALIFFDLSVASSPVIYFCLDHQRGCHDLSGQLLQTMLNACHF